MKEYRELRKRYSILQIAKTPELACRVTLQPVRAFSVDAAIIFSDLLVPLEPMGISLRFAPGPVIDNPIQSSRDVRRLRDFDPREELSCVLEAIRLVRRELGSLPLIGFAGAPFTLASYLLEGGPSGHFLKTKAFMYEEPKAWGLLMRRLSCLTGDYLKAQIASGVQAVQLFDSWVGALSPEDYRHYVLPYSRSVFEALQGEGVPLIHFGTGTSGFLEDFAAAGGDVIGVDWRVDLAAAWERIGPRAIQGNLDPALLIAPKPVLRKAVQRILSQARGHRGFIFNVGHGILPQTPLQNVRAVVEWVHQGLKDG
jgi:uroporphyrinogen decarboxylase